MKTIFIADPIQSFHPQNETTSFLAHEICKRFKVCYFVELKDLFLENQTLKASAQKVEVSFSKTKKVFIYKSLAHETLDLAKADCVWLRKDPPFDLNFFDHLSLLEIIQDKTLLINNPTSVKAFPEKIFPLAFPKMCPHTLITQNKKRIYEFVQKQKKAVLKPLNLSGGRGIVIADRKDPSLNSLIDILTHNESEFICAQEFVAKAKLGDKRVLVWDGQILGSFLRVPSKKDFRGNLHSGAVFKKTTLTAKEKTSLKILLPFLQKHGLLFAGIDFLDSKVTEINVTSPMGIGEINTLNKSQIEKVVVESLINKIS